MAILYQASHCESHPLFLEIKIITLAYPWCWKINRMHYLTQSLVCWKSYYTVRKGYHKSLPFWSLFQVYINGLKLEKKLFETLLCYIWTLDHSVQSHLQSKSVVWGHIQTKTSLHCFFVFFNGILENNQLDNYSKVSSSWYLAICMQI